MPDPTRILSFDIEISDVFDLDVDEDFGDYAPFHVSVASTAVADGEECLWYSSDPNGTPSLNMAKIDAKEMLAYLSAMADDGYMLCAWNGLKFDLQWIGYAAKDLELAGALALKLYDPMFQFFNQKGFPVSLAAVAEGMGIQQKKLMDGADAPREWCAGNHKKVMDYVMGDSQMTNQVVRAIAKRGEIRWITRNGYGKVEQMRGLKTVKEVLQYPEPDQSWLKHPIRRAEFLDWIPDHLLGT